MDELCCLITQERQIAWSMKHETNLPKGTTRRDRYDIDSKLPDTTTEKGRQMTVP